MNRDGDAIADHLDRARLRLRQRLRRLQAQPGALGGDGDRWWPAPREGPSAARPKRRRRSGRPTSFRAQAATARSSAPSFRVNRAMDARAVQQELSRTAERSPSPPAAPKDEAHPIVPPLNRGDSVPDPAIESKVPASMPRTRSLVRPVTITLDGRPIEARPARAARRPRSWPPGRPRSHEAPSFTGREAPHACAEPVMAASHA